MSLMFPSETFGFRANVISLGDRSCGHYASEIFFKVSFSVDHIWLSYLSRDDWLATVPNGDQCSQIEVKFETSSPHTEVPMCGVRLVYEEDVKDINSEIAQEAQGSRASEESIRFFNNVPKKKRKRKDSPMKGNDSQNILPVTSQ